MKSNAQHQAAYRARQSEKLARRETALRAIIARLEGNPRPIAVELRTIAETALTDIKARTA